jgi:alkylation response protein AidB-like acyl-CoA dehydrogenase
MDTLLADSVEKFLAGCCTPAVVREAEQSQQAGAAWADIEASGYLDLLVTEAAGGAGLALPEAFAVWLACGSHALPLPMAQTMLVRAALAQAGLTAPAGPLALATHCSVAAGGAIRCQGVPMGLVADWVLVADAGHAQGAWLLPVSAGERCATGVHGSLQANCHWPATPAGANELPATPAGANELPATPAGAIELPAGFSWLHAGALLSAALMAGAMQRVLDATLAYANDREQFGKSIGKFQAVQQQLSVMAEQVFAARMAAEIGCACDGTRPHPLRAALAKTRAGEAAEKVVAIAHAVHGAIGVTAEYDLQLYTRRLQEWRGDFGSQACWHAQLGQALLAAPQATTLQFLLDELLPTAALPQRMP